METTPESRKFQIGIRTDRPDNDDQWLDEEMSSLADWVRDSIDENGKFVFKPYVDPVS